MQSGKKRLLVVTHTAGFRHADSIELGEKILAEIGARSGVFEVDYCRDAGAVQKMLTPEFLNAGKYDGVVFLNTTGDIGIPNLGAFLEWLEGARRLSASTPLPTPTITALNTLRCCRVSSPITASRPK